MIKMERGKNLHFKHFLLGWFSWEFIAEHPQKLGVHLGCRAAEGRVKIELCFPLSTIVWGSLTSGAVSGG